MYVYCFPLYQLWVIAELMIQADSSASWSAAIFTSLGGIISQPIALMALVTFWKEKVLKIFLNFYNTLVWNIFFKNNM